MSFFGVIADILTLGAAKVDAATGIPMAQAVRDLGKDGSPDEAFGEVPMLPCLGVTSLPAAADDTGHAEGVILENVGALNGVCVGGRDTRTADVAGQLAPGETCLHSTGPGFDSRAFCKDQLFAAVVGADVAFVMDRKSGKISLAGFGALIEMTAGHIALAGPGGKCGLLMKSDGNISVFGVGVTLGGLTGVPVIGVTNAIRGPAGITGSPAANVHLVD